MSSLERIRKHPGLVITVLGAALVLFIITGVSELPALFSTNRDTVAKVDGTKLKYNDLMQRTQQLQASYKQQGRNMNNIDYAQIEQEALNQMINETLINNAIDRLGITVTNDEMKSILFGPTAVPYVVQRANQYGFATPEEFYQYGYSKEPGAEAVLAAWNEMEDALREQLTIQKYLGQLDALKANKLDAKSYYDDNAKTSTVAYVKVDYSTLPDDQFEVTPAEINRRYLETKERYAIPTEQRVVDYILLRPTPSSDDYIAAQQEVEEAIKGLKELPSTDAVSSNYNFEVTNVVGPLASIKDNAIKNIIPSLASDTTGVKLVSFTNNTYTIAKLLDSYVASDSVYVDLALIDTTSAGADSILAELNKGVPADSIGEQLLASQKDLGLPLVQNAFTSFKEQLAAAPAGEYFIPENNATLFQALTGQATDKTVVAVKVNHFTNPVEIYEVARITRVVEPSSTTLNRMEEDLNGYLAEHPTDEMFKETEGSSYTTQTTTVDGSMLTMLGLPSSGAATRWAMEGKKGQVSPVFKDDQNTYMLALAIADIYKDGYRPTTDTQVSNEITNRIRAEKKGAKLVADYQGKAKDVAGYAAVMNATPDTVAITYGQDYVRGFYPGDPAVFANVAVAKEGEVVGPLSTRNSAVVFEVIGVEQQGREFDYENDAMQFNRTQGVGRLQQNLQNILRGKKKIDYSVQRFTQAVEE